MREFKEEFKVKVKDAVYTAKLTGRIPRIEGPDEKLMGYCCPEKKLILIRESIPAEEALEYYVHELLHALDFEYDLGLKHSVIYRLQYPIAKLLLDNYL